MIDRGGDCGGLNHHLCELVIWEDGGFWVWGLWD